MKLTVSSAISAFGAKAKEKLANAGATGEPEDQIRAPFEQLLSDFAELCDFPRSSVVAVGESTMRDLKTRPDYAVTVQDALVGFVELKAPGKGADPRKFKDPHDRDQWAKLHPVPNLLYTDGNAFSLWQDGELVDSVINLVGDIESSGSKLQAPPGLLTLFEKFLRWHPIPPRNAKELARTSARLCHLLRDEVIEQLALRSEALTDLATDWRKFLFPDATDERFADGYAQAVTFGMLMARAKDIKLADGLQQVASELSHTSSLIGAALRLLTDNAENQATLKTSLGTLMRVLDAVEWQTISKGNPETWLYFYEDFLEVYDNQLRKLTGSYYTPPEVVNSMVGLVDEVLKTSRYGLKTGLASSTVKLIDPGVGTGTFLLGVLRRISDTVKEDEGEGSVGGAINAALSRLMAFEIQLGPFAVAQLRILAEVVELTGAPPNVLPHMFVTDTLGNPFVEQEYLPTMYKAIGESRKAANKIKREEPITVVIGNPPYKEKAKGRGGWVEGDSEDKISEKTAPLADWMPPRAMGRRRARQASAQPLCLFLALGDVEGLRPSPGNSNTGIVCFITVAGFLNGPGFQKMRDYLRRTCDDIWVIDCSPEGHQPEVNTRIFQAVQQPVCIVLASRSAKNNAETPAKVCFQALPSGNRTDKFAALGKLTLTSKAWIDCPMGWREPFLPASTGAWAAYPALEDLFIYNGSGVMPGRTWVIAPDVESLQRRWQTLITAPATEKETLFHPHILKEGLGDRHTKRVVSIALAGFEPRPLPIADEHGECSPPVRYGFRSFDRQWIIPDNRVINRPNPELWELRSDQQVFLTALSRTSPSIGPALTITGCVPDLDHYNGSRWPGFPLWRDAKCQRLQCAAQVAHLSGPEIWSRYQRRRPGRLHRRDRRASGLHRAFSGRPLHAGSPHPVHRRPETLSPKPSNLGRTIIWLHTFGERMTDPAKGRPAQPPRLPAARRPNIPKDGAIPQDPLRCRTPSTTMPTKSGC
jgi:hypothetical protein